MPDRDGVAGGVASSVSGIPSEPKRPKTAVGLPSGVVDAGAATAAEGTGVEMVRKGTTQTRNVACAAWLLWFIHHDLKVCRRFS